MDATDAVRTFYDRWARLYDVLATAPGVAAWRRATVDALALETGDTVLEMGCGTGANLPHLRERVGPTGTVLGVDLSAGVLDRARGRIDRAGWANVHVCRADATAPPIAAPVDAVLATFVVGLLDDPAEAVRGWCDLVGDGGCVALLNFQRRDGALAGPLNRAFDAAVWLAAPGWRGTPRAAGDGLARRVDAARDALVEQTVDRRDRTFAGGFLGLVSGRVAPTA
ncbi:MAG: class I SAM-dependent methyltransferase [Haloarculaceae archaeon]